MNDFRDFGMVKTNELWMQRHGFWKPYYELTDGQFTYGKLSYSNLMMRTAIVESANVSWKLLHKKVWTENQLVTDMQNAPLGELNFKAFKHQFNLKLSNGFEASFKKPSIWKSKYVWVDNNGDVIAECSHRFFSSRSVKFVINPAHAAIVHLPLLLITGAHLMFLIQRRAAAH